MIIEDTRQKIKAHDLKHRHFQEMGVELERCALPFGDYALPPAIAVDTKQNMDEIAANLTGDHARFRRECERAQAAGSHLYILIETEEAITTIDEVHNWVNPRLRVSAKAVIGARLEKAMKTMSHRYGVTFLFCHPARAAETIIEVLTGHYEGGNT